MKQLLVRILEGNPRAYYQKWKKYLPGIVVVVAFLVFLNTAAPVIKMNTSSMEPFLSNGDLIVYNVVRPEVIRNGDIIVFDVDPLLQKRYNYPDKLCHRVIDIEVTGAGLSFRTAGDKTGEDPFLTQASSLRGRQKAVVPVIGYALILVQGSQVIWLIIALIIVGFLYRHRKRFLVAIKNTRASFSGISPAVFSQSQENIRIKMDDMTGRVVQSMNGFSSAMSEYAQHIASHTGAIKSLADAAQHMESVISKQDAVLSATLKNAAQSPAPIPTTQPLVTINEQNVKPDTSHEVEISALDVITVVRLSDDAAPNTDSVKADDDQSPEKPQTPIEITPELKIAVKEYIFEYNIAHGLDKVEMTPDLRSAVWTFIQQYIKTPPLPEPGAYLSAIKTVKIAADSDGLDFDELENDGSDRPKVKSI